MRMSAQNRGGAVLINLVCSKYFFDGSYLGRIGNGAEQMICVKKCRNCEGKCITGDLIKGSKTSVVYLLHPAGLVQCHFFYKERIVKISYGWVIEGKMSVFAYA